MTTTAHVFQNYIAGEWQSGQTFPNHSEAHEVLVMGAARRVLLAWMSLRSGRWCILTSAASYKRRR